MNVALNTQHAAAADPLIAKYDVASPRYAGYPTVPYWDNAPDEATWLRHLHRSIRNGEATAIYVHLPFCRQLCTFCGCNTRIARTHAIVTPYIDAVLAEYAMYRERLGVARPRIGELYLGGGTPTFLTSEELERLLEGLLSAAEPVPGAQLSIEADPRVTHREQLEVLARHGFRHISFGVQDFDPRVQEIVNREQSEAQVRAVTEAARELGFDSVNFDLIYGLPLQTRASIETTLNAVCRLRPDRVALYGYAHVPWIRPGQRQFTEADLPEGHERRALYELARQRLEDAGYREIGFDHFALPGDAWWKAAQRGTLHRNFMGYSVMPTQSLLGLGVSAIGDAGDALAQNDKDLQSWQQRIARRELPIQRGHVLDAEDVVLRRHMLRLMTRLATSWDGENYTPYLAEVPARLAEFATDGLVELQPHGVRVTPAGRAFLRNICMVFDARMARQSPEKALFNR